ncbi:hypothetical protein MLD38_040553 [Melastoma candidum]|nr:hypothetical protein MLD38_040553 [Melastoma candidum]
MRVGFQTGRDGRIREVMVNNTDLDMKRPTGMGSGKDILAILTAEKEEVESMLNKEKLASVQLKQELSQVESRNGDLYKELQSVRSQLAREQSRSFKLEVDVAELRQKLQTMETLQRELNLLERQKAESEQAALSARHRQGSGTGWSWLTGMPPPSHKSEDDL